MDRSCAGIMVACTDSREQWLVVSCVDVVFMKSARSVAITNLLDPTSARTLVVLPYRQRPRHLEQTRSADGHESTALVADAKRVEATSEQTLRTTRAIAATFLDS